MENKTVISIETVIGYIEDHLSGKLDLETVATAVNYSKYHLHRIFTKTVGMTMHDYVQRRQLTEAAKLLVFSDKPIIEIAFICGYESQQSFTTAFTAMYKTSPAQYRDKQAFYPLLLRFTLHDKMQSAALTKNDIRLAVMEDIPSWMELLRLVVDGYPVLGETYCFAMCVLEEMQWIATKSIHAAEFFHGTVEMTEKDMSFMLMKGEDETRPLVDRVENFVRKYSDVVEVWDTKDFELEGIDEDMRKFMSPMVMSSQLERVSAHFEHVRNHSLEIRRYYRTVEY